MSPASALTPVSGFSLALAALFAALAAWPWLASERTADPSPAVFASQSSPATPEPPRRDAASLAAVVGRPLFSPSRRPAAGEGAAPPQTPRAVALRVEGIIEIAGRRQAIIRREGAAESVRVAEGDAFDGWTVRMIAADRVVLTSASGETVLPAR